MPIPATSNILNAVKENVKLPLEAPLARDVMQQLFANMLRARLLSERLPKAASMGEAILAGTVQNLGDDLVLTAGSHPVLRALCGDELASVFSAQSKHVPDKPASRVVTAPPETAISIATGLALASRRLGSTTTIVAMLPERVTRGKLWEQSTEFAAYERLPMVIISDGTHGRNSPRDHNGGSLSRWPFPTIAVDGRDVIAVYRVTKEALSAARRGHGPTFVDCVNFLAPGRRGRDERDPLASFRGYLQRHNLWSDFWHSELQSKYRQEIASAWEQAKRTRRT